MLEKNICSCDNSHMRKLLLVLFLFFVVACQNADAAWISDLRELFIKDKAVILVVNPRTMGAKDTNGNDIIDFDKNEESGNFVNAVARLDNIKKQGFNTLHVLPVTPVGTRKALGTAGSLYAMNGFDSINPQLDSKKNKSSAYQELRYFIAQCHKRDIRVILDLPSCGAYDLYLTNPQLFLLDESGQPIVPSDWTDVRVFKTKNPDGTLNRELMDYHKKFIDMVVALDADGIRADVATMKPYEFWKELISYTRSKSPNFLFLAETSNKWNEKVCKQCEFTPYDKLLEAGFDGYYGGYVEYQNFKSVNDILNEVKDLQNLSKKLNSKKAVIASFATHDMLSPVLAGGKNYASQILWLSVVLPVNPYYVDGFQSLDSYIYDYSNQKASKTFTDDDYYYVHKGKLDIFNFSRRPVGNDEEFLQEFVVAQKMRTMLEDLPYLGNFKVLKTNNADVWAFMREYNKVKVILILNRANHQQIDVVTSIPKISSEELIFPARIETVPKIQKSKIKSNLKPYETQVFVWQPKEQ